MKKIQITRHLKIPHNMMFERGGFFGITLFNRDFLGINLVSFVQYGYEGNFEFGDWRYGLYRQFYISTILFFVDFGVVISWRRY